MQTEETSIEQLKLKTTALLQRISELTAEYENKIADLRVNLTTLNEERNGLVDALGRSEEAREAQRNESQGVVDSEVVEDNE